LFYLPPLNRGLFEWATARRDSMPESSVTAGSVPAAIVHEAVDMQRDVGHA
jgi:hypothetical protein